MEHKKCRVSIDSGGNESKNQMTMVLDNDLNEAPSLLSIWSKYLACELYLEETDPTVGNRNKYILLPSFHLVIIS